MTLKKIFLLAIVFWALLSLLKVWFFNDTIFSNQAIQGVVFWSIVAVITVTLIRRLGVIQYLESFFVISVWAVGDLIIDVVLTVNFTGTVMFAKLAYWVSFLIFAFFAFTFHKKRHIQIRHQHDAHHGHGGH